jgi:hypothetical protein
VAWTAELGSCSEINLPASGLAPSAAVAPGVQRFALLLIGASAGPA